MLNGARQWLCTRAALLALLVIASPARAMDPNKAFHHYVRDSWSIEDGLPQITVNAITQDRDGYIWLGTQAGVARFDGVRFRTYSTSNASELPGAFINSLLADPQGRVWIGTYKGLAVYQQQHLRRIPVADGEAALDIQALARTARGTVLAGTPQGVYAVQDDTLVRRHALPGPAQSLLTDDSGLWVGSLGGAYRIESDQTVFHRLPADSANAVITQLADAQKKLWAGTGVGLFVLHDGQWRPYAGDEVLARAPIEEIFPDHDGNLWVATLDKLFRLRNAQVVERIHRDHTDLAVRSGFEDNEGNLWLGSQWQGVTRLWNGSTRRYSKAEGLHDPVVWSLARAENGDTWVGTETGVSRLHKGRYELVVPGADLPHPNAYTLLLEDQRVWIGTRRGVAVWEDGKLSQPESLADLAGAQINGIHRDKKGALWFATTNGLFRLTDDVLVRFGEAAGLSDPRVRYLYETKDGRLLLGGQGGLYEFKDERLVAIPLDNHDGSEDSHDVTVISELADGKLVFGTLSQGLHLFTGNTWVNLSHDAGLPSFSPFFISSHDGYLWVAGIRGIYRVELAALANINPDAITPLRSEMLLNERGDRRGGQKGYCCNGAGNAKGFRVGSELWLPSRDGVVALATQEVKRNLVAPTTRIERIRVNGHWRNADPDTDWNLPQDARDLTFKFTVLAFQDPQSVDLRYRLQGYDRDWHTLDDPSRRLATYTNLPPGNYRFEVSGSNNSGVWSPEPARFAFRIQPRFHETKVFLVMLAALVASLLFGAYRYLVGVHRRQSLALQLLVKQRTEALEVSNRRLEDASQIDALTGLRNRRFLANQLPADIAYYERERSKPSGGAEALVFALIEIDQLSEVRRRHGADVADHLLQQASALLSRWLRRGDYIARWSDHEFLLVFRPLPQHQLPTLGHRLCHAINQQVFEPAPGQAYVLSGSLGLVECPLFREARGRLSWEQIIEIAGHAKQQAIAKGGGVWAALRPKAGHTLDDLRAATGGDISEAVRLGQLDLLVETAPQRAPVDAGLV